MNERVLALHSLAEIEALRRECPASALSRLNDAPSELIARPEARLIQAELVHQLRGPAAARPLLIRLVAEFPKYGSAFHHLALVHDALGERAAALECRLAVHSLDAILDDALEPRDVAELEQAMTQAAADALTVAPSWVRGRLAIAPIDWRGRPELAEVEQGLDPRALATLREVPSTAGSVDRSAARATLLQLVLYRTNLLASADDESELHQNLRVAVRELLERMA